MINSILLGAWVRQDEITVLHESELKLVLILQIQKIGQFFLMVNLHMVIQKEC